MTGIDATSAVQTAGPVDASERFISMDMLRGVAVLGILVMNIYAFAMPFSAYMNPLEMGGTEWYNMAIWFATHIVADQKFIAIFSMMFGAGLVLMTGRAESRGIRPAGLYFRRQFWLLVIGLIHAYLIWVGDILVAYAVLGMLFYRFRTLRPRTLIIIACLLLPIAPLFSYGNAIYTEQVIVKVDEIELKREAGEELDSEEQRILEEWEGMRGFMAPEPEDLQAEVEAYQQGYSEIVIYRAPIAAMLQIASILIFGLWRIGAMMLIGMAMMKLGVFTGQLSAAAYRKMMFAGYLLGLPLMIVSAWQLNAHGWDTIKYFRVDNLWNYVGSLCMAFGHIGLVMLIAKTGAFRRIMLRFAAVGRMALSNYLLHSIILTTVFYGYGFGLFGQVPRLGQMGFVIAVIGLQLIVSPWWLQRYRFGPAEWLWRSLTYWRRQPLRAAETPPGR